jgi:hypothetical protein
VLVNELITCAEGFTYVSFTPHVSSDSHYLRGRVRLILEEIQKEKQAHHVYPSGSVCNLSNRVNKNGRLVITGSLSSSNAEPHIVSLSYVAALHVL